MTYPELIHILMTYGDVEAIETKPNGEVFIEWRINTDQLKRYEVSNLQSKNA